MINTKGRTWIQSNLKREPSSLGALVADVLHETWWGIYHLESKALSKVAWEDDSYIAITLFGSLATFDANTLLRLVVAAHDAGLRLNIRAKALNYLELSFNFPCAPYPFPTLDAAVAKIREDYQAV